MKYKNHTIYERKDKRWSVTLRIENDYKHIYGKTQEICLNNLKTFLKENNKKTTTNKENITLNEWLEIWLKTFKEIKLKHNTLKSYNNIIKNHIKPSIGKSKLKELTPEKIQTHLNNLQEKTPRQAQKVYELLKDILTKAGKKSLLEFVEKPKHQAKETAFLTISQQEQFINYCKKRNNTITDYLLLELYNGFRPSEVKSLFINDIDFINKKISIIEKKDKKLFIKTNESQRTVPMLNGTYEILLKYKNYKEQIFKISNKPLYEELKKLNKELKTNITNSSLRHTFITRMQEKQTPLHILQWLVGHKKGSIITNKTYTHKDMEFVKDLDLNF